MQLTVMNICLLCHIFSCACVDLESYENSTRHNFNAIISDQDLEEVSYYLLIIFKYSNDVYYQTYLPAFRACVEKGGAGSIMCSYNAVNGIPNCASDYLNNQIARGQWGFEGYIVRIIIFLHCILVLYRSVIVVL